MTRKQHYNIYVASCDKNGGIYHYHLCESGILKRIGFTPVDRPMYMTIANNKMYILLRAPFVDNPLSGLVIYDIGSDGGLCNPSDIISTKGRVACHLTVSGENIYCVNYISGNLIRLPDGDVIQHIGKGINLERQEGPHTHFVGMTPDGKYLCVTDLGLDTIFIYDKKLQCINKTKGLNGHGVRHLVFSEDGKTCFSANELKSTVSAFEYSDANMKLIDTESCLEKDFIGESTASAIRFLDGHIYVSNRGDNSISVMTYEKEKLKLIGTYDCGGKFPRDFDVINEFIIVTNEKSNNISIINKNNMNLVYIEEKIKSPICVVYNKIIHSSM